MKCKALKRYELICWSYKGKANFKNQSLKTNKMSYKSNCVTTITKREPKNCLGMAQRSY